MNLEANRKSLKELVEQFRYNLKDYTSWNFNETNTRQQFIDKFFELLGRDVNNNFWRSEQYKEVVLEDKIKIWGQAKAPDYSFRLWWRRIFFVEAKKPSINIKDEVEPAYQIRRYSWTAQLPIGILTDFEELAIYDTRIKPNPKDKAGTARIKYFNFEEFEENWEWIYNTLSKEAVEKWALDKYIEEGKKRWTQSVDVDFLNMIDDWRDALAKNIYLRYGNERNRDFDRLNQIVGDIVDKIIFLRIAEDKQIEKHWNLENIGKWKEIWKNLILYFEKSDKKYNSWLFGNTEMFKKFELDDKILKEILLSLYYPVCPYEFSVLGVDILGNIYEKFLGKTIVKEWRTIKTEFKPDVKKAWWVFYTPKYIVDYIVKNTVWELLKWKTPKQALELKIVDPACGSGAFLIWAYDYILNRFLEQHTLNDKEIKSSAQKGQTYKYKDSYFLSFNYKSQILTSMIYGVDIDNQAVAVSKLSLLLKLLEWETAETTTLNKLFSGADSALLPNLETNIKCGNSLVDSSIYANLEIPDEATIKKINAFDREKEFSDIFAKWGFDAVIWNPPYIQLQKMAQEQWRFEKMNFETFAKTGDIYGLFYEKWNQLLKTWWKLGFITSNKRMRTGYGELLRKYLATETNPIQLLDFGGFKVFRDATVDVNILIFEKWKNKNQTKACIIQKDFNEMIDLNQYFKKNKIDLKWLSQEIWTILDPIEQSIKTKVESIWTPLKDWDIKINYWIKTWYNEAFIIDNNKRNELILQDPKSAEIIKPILRWRDIKRYHYEFANLYIINTHNGYQNSQNEKVERIKIEDYPAIKKHLDSFGEKVKNRFDQWDTHYNLRNCAYMEEFEKEKIIRNRITDTIKFCFGALWDYILDSSFFITWNNLKFLIWFLNSSFVKYRIWQNSANLWTGVYGAKIYIEKIPIPQVSETKQKPIIELVDQMLEAQKKLRKADFENDKKAIEKQIEIIDMKIDHLVFDLYGLNEEERKIVLDS